MQRVLFCACLAILILSILHNGGSSGHQVQSSQASHSFYIPVLGTADVLAFFFETHAIVFAKISLLLPQR